MDSPATGGSDDAPAKERVTQLSSEPSKASLMAWKFKHLATSSLQSRQAARRFLWFLLNEEGRLLVTGREELQEVEGRRFWTEGSTQGYR